MSKVYDSSGEKDDDAIEGGVFLMGEWRLVGGVLARFVSFVSFVSRC